MAAGAAKDSRQRLQASSRWPERLPRTRMSWPCFDRLHLAGYPGVGKFQARIFFPPAAEPLRAQVDGDRQARFGNGLDGDLQGLFRCHGCIIEAGTKSSLFLNPNKKYI